MCVKGRMGDDQPGVMWGGSWAGNRKQSGWECVSDSGGDQAGNGWAIRQAVGRQSRWVE